MKIQIEDLNSNGIKAQAKLSGISEVTELATSGAGDSKITVYQFGAVRVATTNGDPVWEESDPSAFADLLKKPESACK